jgi:hypothetical protein
MKPFSFDAQINTTMADGAYQIFQIAQFTMPFYGDMVYVGSIKIQMNAPGIQAPEWIRVHESSTPAPTIRSEAGWRSAGGASFPTSHVPLLASWVGVAAGATVTVNASINNGTGGISIGVYNAPGIMYCFKT